MNHPIEIYSNKIEKTFQLLLDISDELELKLDLTYEQMNKISRFDWIAMAEQQLAKERKLL